MWFAFIAACIFKSKTGHRNIGITITWPSVWLLYDFDYSKLSKSTTLIRFFFNLRKCVIVIGNLLILMLFYTALSTLSFYYNAEWDQYWSVLIRNACCGWRSWFVSRRPSYMLINLVLTEQAVLNIFLICCWYKTLLGIYGSLVQDSYRRRPETYY